MNAADLVRLIESRVRGIGTEESVQETIATVLTAARVSFERECRLSKQDRIDFLVGRVGVEVKVGGGLSAVIRQLHRYAQSDMVDELVLVTSKLTLARVPAELNGKRVRVAALAAGLC
jgi:hypothetical protein